MRGGQRDGKVEREQWSDCGKTKTEQKNAQFSDLTNNNLSFETKGTEKVNDEKN